VALLALSPILTLAVRARSAYASLVLVLLAGLWLAAECDSSGRRLTAAAVGVAAGGLAASGVASFAAVAVLLVAWLALRPERRSHAALACAGALAAASALGAGGLARSPFAFGEVAALMPETSLEGLVRCSGASFTRVIGLEYQLAVSKARFVLPLTLAFVALMARGASRLPRRLQGLLVAGALLPFAVGAVLAAITGRVTPLQADRLMAAIPFVVWLMAAGLASLRGRAAWAAGLGVAGTLAFFQALALR
jgi:hypothetical protein